VSEYAKPPTGTPSHTNTLSVPWVIGAAVLCGVGLFLVLNALILLAGGLTNWLYWIGVVPMTLGFFMLLNPRAGSQGSH